MDAPSLPSAGPSALPPLPPSPAAWSSPPPPWTTQTAEAGFASAATAPRPPTVPDPGLIAAHSSWVGPLREAISRSLVGQHALVDQLLAALLVRGHVLLEGVPGLAKTLALRTLAGLVDARFQRIQFTPDMLPADIVGTQIFDPRSSSFQIKQGPVFAHFILADEINRAPAKVQSALLEAMQERQVTLGEHTFALPQPFLVLATQNPLEQEGTYPLPEAQLDRFLVKVMVDYPSLEEEIRVLEVAQDGASPALAPVVDLATIDAATQVVRSVYLDPRVQHYLVSLVHATRRPADFSLPLSPYLRAGASPRASLALAALGRARAFLDGRGYVTPQDIKDSAPAVLRHRILLSYEAEAEGLDADALIERILHSVPVP